MTTKDDPRRTDEALRLLQSGQSFQSVRRQMRDRFGVHLQYTGADRNGGRAVARRLRQRQREAASA